MKLRLAVLLLAAVYVAVEAQYYDDYVEEDYSPEYSPYELVPIRDSRSGHKGHKGKGLKKGGFWYYWGPTVKHVGHGWGHGGGHHGYGHHGGYGGHGYGGHGYGGHGYGHGGGYGHGYGGHHGGGHHGGGHGGWGWHKPKKHVHYHQPIFPSGGPPLVVKHAPVHVHQSHGWGWGGGHHGGHHGGGHHGYGGGHHGYGGHHGGYGGYE